MANQVNRHDTEEKILDLLEEIMNVYHEYNPDGEYLSLFFSSGDGTPYLSVNNAHWVGGGDEEHEIDAHRCGKKVKRVAV